MKNLALAIGTALLSSLCCITPLLAIIAGTSGMASSFSWLEPFRPYFIGLTVLVLGFSWFQKLKPRKEMDCACDAEAPTTGEAPKKKFIQSKSFLGIVTGFALLMLAFPYYSGIFYPSNENEVIVVSQEDISRIEFKVSGMTCAGCEEHINHEINQLPGIIRSKASYEKGNALVEFDRTKTNNSAIEKAINSTGYVVTNKTEL